MSDTEQDEADKQRIKKAVADLGEFFDTVQIFVTKHTGDDVDENGSKQTADMAAGTGNLYARYGHIKSWVKRFDEQTKIQARADESE